MPILLTTPGDPGDNDPGQSYPRAQITNLEINVVGKVIRFTVGFGDVVESTWSGKRGVRGKSYEITGTDYDTMINELSQTDEKIYDGAARVLYAWLQTNDARFAGTVE